MKGIITKTIGGFFFVADSNQKIYKTKIRGKIREEVYPGDFVKFTLPDGENPGILEQVYDRESLLKRPKVANVNQVLIMQAFKKPPLDRKLLDKFLLLVLISNLEPLIVINKKDLIKNESWELVKDYQAAGFNLYIISVKKEDGIEQLYSQLKDRITVLAGPSGVGKSSLINKLVPTADLKVNPVSESLNRGVHTTREVTLLPIEQKNQKGWLVDTPGFTSLELDNILPEEVAFLYPEFEPYLNECKFNMCTHTHEPNCAVKNAVDRGEISFLRYENYKEIFNQIKNKEEIYD
ncbi:MAG: ribosome small subunit-dependent GTPase A [Bacillota bacterium]